MGKKSCERNYAWQSSEKCVQMLWGNYGRTALFFLSFLPLAPFPAYMIWQGQSLTNLECITNSKHKYVGQRLCKRYDDMAHRSVSNSIQLSVDVHLVITWLEWSHLYRHNSGLYTWKVWAGENSLYHVCASLNRLIPFNKTLCSVMQSSLLSRSWLCSTNVLAVLSRSECLSKVGKLSLQFLL